MIEFVSWSFGVMECWNSRLPMANGLNICKNHLKLQGQSVLVNIFSKKSNECF